MRKRKKSFLPDKSRRMIGDRLLDLIFILICFGICFLVSGAALGLEAGESHPAQYWIAGCGATLPILGRMLQRCQAPVNRIVLGVIWLAACVFICYANLR